MRGLLVPGLLLAGMATAGAQQQMERPIIRNVATEAPVEDLLVLEDGAFIMTREGYAKLVPCQRTLVCAESVGRIFPPQPTPGGGLPDGTVAIRAGGDIVEAWYADPTTRYQHGVLGDEFEAATLRVTDGRGVTHEALLPPEQVFEDLTPRLVDLDNDGTVEVVTIKSDRTYGSSLSIWGLSDDSLVEKAVSEPIGLPRRWLNPLPVENGQSVLAVMTPHIGGPLRRWTYDDGVLSQSTDIAGENRFSNHAIGSRDLSLGWRRGTRWAVPGEERRTMIFGEGETVVQRVELRFAIGDDVAVVGDAMVMTSEAGTLHAIPMPW